MRGKFAAALVVIGSATPTLESYTHAIEGRYTLVTLNRRVLDRPMARVQVVNMREEIAATGAEVVISRPLREAIKIRLDEGEQSLILLNRRGFATSVVCRQCGASLECPNCSVTLTVHTQGREWRGRCHYCNFTKLVPKQCERCAAPYWSASGLAPSASRLKYARPSQRPGWRASIATPCGARAASSRCWSKWRVGRSMS